MEDTSSRSRLRVGGHLPRPVGVSGKRREQKQKKSHNYIMVHPATYAYSLYVYWFNTKKNQRKKIHPNLMYKELQTSSPCC